MQNYFVSASGTVFAGQMTHIHSALIAESSEANSYTVLSFCNG